MALSDETTLADRIRAVCTVFGVAVDELEQPHDGTSADACEPTRQGKLEG